MSGKADHYLKNFGVFIFHFSPVSMQCMLSIYDFMFRKSVLQLFCFQFLISCSLWHPYVKKLHYHILLLELIFFQKLQPPKHRLRQIVNYVMRVQRLHKLRYHRRFLVLFTMLYPLFIKIQ